MGAEISGEGKPEIRIRGVRELSAGDFHIPPDRIVAGTYMCAAAVTKSEIRLRRVPLEEMKAFLDVYRKDGSPSGSFYTDRNVSGISHRLTGTADGGTDRGQGEKCDTRKDI